MSVLFSLLFGSMSNALAKPEELNFGFLRDGDSQAESIRIEEYKASLNKLEARLSDVSISFPPQFVTTARWDQEAENSKELLLIGKTKFFANSYWVFANI